MKKANFGHWAPGIVQHCLAGRAGGMWSSDERGVVVDSWQEFTDERDERGRFLPKRQLSQGVR